MRKHSLALHNRILTRLSERNRPCRIILARLTTRIFRSTRKGKIAFEVYEGQPQAALTLAFRLAELKQLIEGLRKHQALRAIERAIDGLYEHSDFRSVSRELFSTALEGELTIDKEEVLRHLGIRI